MESEILLYAIWQGTDGIIKRIKAFIGFRDDNMLYVLKAEEAKEAFKVEVDHTQFGLLFGSTCYQLFLDSQKGFCDERLVRFNVTSDNEEKMMKRLQELR